MIRLRLGFIYPMRLSLITNNAGGACWDIHDAGEAYAKLGIYPEQ